MKNRVVIKSTRKYVNGKLVVDGEDAQQVQPLYSSLLHNISTANRFAEAAIEDNRSGRLSSSQFIEGCKAIVFAVVFAIAILTLMVSISLGFSAINNQNYSKALPPCTGAIVTLFIAGWIYLKGNKFGVQRYSAYSPAIFARRLLLIPDLMLWRVSVLEGGVKKDRIYTLTEGVRQDGGRPEHRGETLNASRRTTYLYRIDEMEFATSEEGYNSFPDATQTCRIYFLPLSRVMVNLEVL